MLAGDTTTALKMLSNPTIETLKSLKLQGMIQSLEEEQQTPAIHALSFDERLALIVDRERLYRDNQRRTRLRRGARLKVAEACIEDISGGSGSSDRTLSGISGKTC